MEQKANELSERFLKFAALIFQQIKKLHTNQLNRHVTM